MIVRNVPQVTVVVPVFNSAGTIAEVVERVNVALNEYQHNFVLVNDGSTDGSYEVCLRMAESDPRIGFISFFRNYGQLSAILAGLRAADGEIVIVMDDDLQNPPEEAPKLLAAIQQGYDFVFGKPIGRMQQSLGRRLGSYLNRKMSEVVFNKPKGLYASSYYAITQRLAQAIVRYDGPYPYISGFIFRTTSNGCNVAVEHHPRKRGESGYTLTKLIGLWLRGLTNFSVVPLRLSMLVGFTASLIGLVVLFYILLLKIYAWDQVSAGWTSTIGTVLLSSGVQLFSLGVLGEYVGRIFLLLNKQPQYTVREMFNCTEENHDRRHRGDRLRGTIPDRALGKPA
jgi:polyisoprenyl-phosphate glycosyltransferase